MESRSGSFRGVRFGGVERASSLRLLRSNSSALLFDSISLECARISSYERLSESMRFADHEDWSFNVGSPNKKRSKAKEFLSRVFRGGGEVKVVKVEDPTSKVVENTKKKEKKVRCSWLPDPRRRWPVQGW